VQCRRGGQPFDGCGKFLQGFSDTLGPRYQLTAIRGGKVVVLEAVLQALKGFHIGRSSRDSV
jgi:hypothetical protein